MLGIFKTTTVIKKSLLHCKQIKTGDIEILLL